MHQHRTRVRLCFVVGSCLQQGDMMTARLQVAPLARRLGALCRPARAFALSALSGAGTRALRAHLAAAAVPEEWELPAGVPTDLTWPELAAELVREKLYWAHNHEVPYRLQPTCDDVRELRDGRIAAAVVRPRRCWRACSGTRVAVRAPEIESVAVWARVCLCFRDLMRASLQACYSGPLVVSSDHGGFQFDPLTIDASIHVVVVGAFPYSEKGRVSQSLPCCGSSGGGPTAKPAPTCITQP